MIFKLDDKIINIYKYDDASNHFNTVITDYLKLFC